MLSHSTFYKRPFVNRKGAHVAPNARGKDYLMLHFPSCCKPIISRKWQNQVGFFINFHFQCFCHHGEKTNYTCASDLKCSMVSHLSATCLNLTKHFLSVAKWSPFHSSKSKSLLRISCRKPRYLKQKGIELFFRSQTIKGQPFLPKIDNHLLLIYYVVRTKKPLKQRPS